VSEPTDLDIRIGAMQQEYQAQITALCNRSVTLAAELASAQAKANNLESKILELDKQKKK
jgi:septal ring factor EnvC (AmiA/AmiB activator)